MNQLRPHRRRHRDLSRAAALAAVVLATLMPALPARSQCPIPEPAISAARWCIADIPFYWGPGLEANNSTTISWRAAVNAAVTELNALGAVDLATPLYLFNAGVVGPNDPAPPTGIIFYLVDEGVPGCSGADESTIGLTIAGIESSNNASLDMITGAAVIFNAGARAAGYNLATIARHEICHALGVGHSGGTDCLMSVSVSCGQSRLLDASATQALVCLYGDNFGGDCAANYGITVESTAAATVDFRIGACNCSGGGCAKNGGGDRTMLAPQALTYELAISEAGGPYDVFASPMDTDLTGGRYSHTFNQPYSAGMVRLRVLNGATVVDQAFLNFPLAVQAASAAPIVTPAGPSLAVRNAPNPFAGETELSFTLPSAGAVSVIIYDAAGRRVATVHDGALAGGTHRLVWSGRGDDGAPVASGVYRAAVKTDGRIESRKVVKVR
jgi:hypothetical protein